MVKKRLGSMNWMARNMQKYFEDQGYEIVNLNKYVPWKHPDWKADFEGLVKEAKTCDIISIPKGFHYKKHQLEREMIRDIKKPGNAWVFYHNLDIPNKYENALTWEGLLKYYRDFWLEADLVCFPYLQAVDMAKEHGLNAHIIHPGYDPAFDSDLNNPLYSNSVDITICGKCYSTRSEFPRSIMAKRLIDEGFSIKLWGWFWLDTVIREEECGHLVGGDPSLKNYFFGDLGGRNAGPGNITQGLTSGKITISSHLLSGLEEYTNGRMYEAMGLGKCLFSDENPGMENVGFKDGENLVFYHSLDELVEKAHYYLAHENRRNEIGRKARELILSKHTQYMRGEYLYSFYNGK